MCCFCCFGFCVMEGRSRCDVGFGTELMGKEQSSLAPKDYKVTKYKAPAAGTFMIFGIITWHIEVMFCPP